MLWEVSGPSLTSDVYHNIDGWNLPSVPNCPDVGRFFGISTQFKSLEHHLINSRYRTMTSGNSNSSSIVRTANSFAGNKTTQKGTRAMAIAASGTIFHSSTMLVHVSAVRSFVRTSLPTDLSRTVVSIAGYLVSPILDGGPSRWNMPLLYCDDYNHSFIPRCTCIKHKPHNSCRVKTRQTKSDGRPAQRKSERTNQPTDKDQQQQEQS